MIVNDRKTVPLRTKSGLTIRRPRKTDRDEATKVGENVIHLHLSIFGG